MKHAVILAHPDADSFNAAVARAYAEAVTAGGGEAVVRDLYRLGFDPCLHADELPWTAGHAPRADVVAERALLADARVFVLVYPLWFNAPPAILKGYVDRVFAHGFGFGSIAGGTEPLLIGRSLISFTSSGAPDRWVEETGAVRMLATAFDHHLGEMCGLAVADHVHFGGIVPGIRRDAVEALLQRVRDRAAKFAGG
ncbi:MAG TPA: NAD(P)H-dependent oxidoreductase [Caulobacteraceae bacterium]|nr:NAD(P)H-dependent oxidoreductase [Caulobacteraceae bacterium]